MKVLIAEDDFASRKFMLRFFEKYGECDVTVDGKEAVEAYKMAIECGEPYDLICLDIMMPEMDGHQALKTIRKIEEESGIAEDERVKIVMTTALSETRHVTKAFENGCTAYAGKPINQDKLEAMLKKFKLIEE
ncbi:response regulator [Catonella massiliensis]|jgi:hypothetical protein|uniref:Stage 0 sporulation protein A homolog n=1 Tax=Catonella massiliensis TaxID=2799636 RepID=A0ABS1IWR8_9FIRM|nr:response regulator [Catonella massiliensis]MBK5896250.1 response regulator [Catonella massiliensis]